jgi:Outer membrane protein beta-barrel domain
MKKALLAVILLSSLNFAQWGSSSIKLGYFSPSAANGGFIIGYEGDHFFDPRISLGWSLDWFHKNYTDEKLVNDFNQIDPGVNSSVNELRAKTNIHDFPLMLNVTGNYPVADNTAVSFTGAIGAEVLLIDYRNFENPDNSEFKSAFDFNWRLGIGVMYEIGRRSDFLAELDYHSAKPSYEYQVDLPSGGQRTYERVFDMSGVMFRVGFRFYY